MGTQNEWMYKVQSPVIGGGQAVGAGAARNAKMNGVRPGVNGAQQTQGAGGFANILDQAVQKNSASGLKISKHAETRLNERNIRLSDDQKRKIANALEKAGGKGVRDALVMIDGFALVANARSMTVITAAGEDDLRRNIITNIDGAVFA